MLGVNSDSGNGDVENSDSEANIRDGDIRDCGNQRSTQIAPLPYTLPAYNAILTKWVTVEYCSFCVFVYAEQPHPPLL